jgi:hypothetical protein
MGIRRDTVRAWGALLGAWALAGCASGPCYPGDKACLREAITNHPVRSAASWQADRGRPVAQRIAPAPHRLVEFITMDNVLHGFPERPRPAAPDAAFMEDVKAAIAELPPEVWALFGERLVGIYLVEALGGTGYTGVVLGPDGQQVAGLVVLDAAVLAQRSANGWASWKENTPFKPRDGYQLSARIEADADDNRKNAIQYILLHELGHVLSIGGDIHPAWNLDPKDVPADSRHPFFDLSWKIDRDANKYVTLFDNEFVQRKSTAYYFGAKLDAADMEPTYSSLAKTSFPSLYAATHPGDDFAEAFASYVHVVLQKRPWEITISQDGKVVRTFKSCWEEARCAEKRKLLERMLR